jgi:hypothetical protein
MCAALPVCLRPTGVLTVNRAAPTFLKAFTITNKTFGDAPFSLLPFTEGLDNTDGTYHFSSSNPSIVSISTVDNVTALGRSKVRIYSTIYIILYCLYNIHHKWMRSHYQVATMMKQQRRVFFAATCVHISITLMRVWELLRVPACFNA